MCPFMSPCECAIVCDCSCVSAYLMCECECMHVCLHVSSLHLMTICVCIIKNCWGINEKLLKFPHFK